MPRPVFALLAGQSHCGVQRLLDIDNEDFNVYISTNETRLLLVQACSEVWESCKAHLERVFARSRTVPSSRRQPGRPQEELLIEFSPKSLLHLKAVD